MRERPAIPAGLPLVWVPALVLRRLWQLYWQVYEPQPLDHRGMRQRRNLGWSGHGERIPRAVLAWAGDCAVTAVRGQRKWQTRCPTCRRQAVLLLEAADGGYWRCGACGPGLAGLELAMAVYASGLRLGLGGYLLHRERGRVLRMGQQLAAHARTPADLITLAELAALAGPRPAHRRIYRGRGLRRLRRRYERGPVAQALAPLVIPAMIDTVLHPRVFLARFGTRRCEVAA